MDSRRRAWLLNEAQGWVDAGIIDAEQRRRIGGHYPEAEVRASLATRTFYVLGGALLGAAVFALWVFLDAQGVIDMDDGRFAWWMFATFAAVWYGIAAFVIRDNPELGEAFLVAGLIQSTALVGPDPGPDFLFAFAPLAAAAVFVWRMRDAVIPVIALAAFEGATPAALMHWLEDGDAAVTTWLVVAALAFAGVVVLVRSVAVPWRHIGLAVAAIGAAVGWVALSEETLTANLDWDGAMEAVVAVGLAAVLGVGLLLREPSALYVGGLGLTVDAVVFAFDVGGLNWGLGTLIVLSVGLITAASLLRRHQKDTRA